MKLITFAVPCYNSADYLDRCVRSLLSAGADTEILLIDDGSTDATPALADRYAADYPEQIRTIHQPNGGHGEGVNQGLRCAEGIYYKVVDSDDWLDGEALSKVLNQLREFVAQGTQLDLMLFNYVYEHVDDASRRIVRYKNVFPQNRIFSWNEAGRFRESQYLLMHSVIYRADVLRASGLELPKHTFYVDNIFIYQPLPYVKTIYYMDEDLYRYCIGRGDQSVNEQVMIGRIDQQIHITQIMTDCCDLNCVAESNPALYHYMTHYLAIMYTICSTLLMVDGSKQALEKRKNLWSDLQTKDLELFRRLRYHSLALWVNLPGWFGRKIGIIGYRVVQKIFKFN